MSETTGANDPSNRSRNLGARARRREWLWLRRCDAKERAAFCLAVVRCEREDGQPAADRGLQRRLRRIQLQRVRQRPSSRGGSAPLARERALHEQLVEHAPLVRNRARREREKTRVLGAESPAAQNGLPPRNAVAFSFLATRLGTYRIACLVPAHEQAGMWDVLDVTRDRLPAVILLRRLP